ncbi:MAG: hypothetical protein E4H16_04355 [Candidatus Atribacteria bacterium]|nr:MAG: hypothetical protein E4H16_04355 [Candidatus Atribacteria bacterium]
MNKRFHFFVTMLSIMLFFAINVQAEELGQVYYNGELLKHLEGDQPYVFTCEGGDTLYLNGIPYSPVRKPVAPGPPKKVSEKYVMQHKLNVLADKHSKQGKTDEERYNLMAEIYLASPLIDSVRVERSLMWIFWKDDPDGEAVSLSHFEAEPFDRLAHHKTLQEGFWRIFNRGGFIAFSEKGYFITAPKHMLDRSQMVIEKIKKGENLVEEDFKGTILWAKDFRSEYEAKHNISFDKDPGKE